MTAGWAPEPLAVRTDLARGGRWTSLAAPGREWLWHHPDPAVQAARASAVGPAFVDAGGGEECLPTVDGDPDHGAVWPLAWQPGAREGEAAVAADGLALRRHLAARAGVVRAAYRVSGAPGQELVHAVHLLLDLSPAARVRLPAVGVPCAVREERPGAPGRPRRWSAPWPPRVGEHDADRLGPDDGTAAAVLVPGCDRALVVDGDDALELRWGADHDQPVSLLLWRNLRGWPAGAPYRSTGLEPLLGATSDLAAAQQVSARGGASGDRGGAARLDASGQASWWLEVRTRRRPGPQDRPGQAVGASSPGGPSGP
ncbi:hypothetical protein GCM10009756_15350 [Pseudokineococcus marinus]|uniref:hypothetical protein n=1 Tax=Pseudokineococcus marinus TaxID=351215 RepID=UPI0031DCB61D